MRIKRVDIEGFRSIAVRMRVVLDPTVTVILGANDHGKTNVLDALTYLNLEKSFSEDDVNWDIDDNDVHGFPRITAELELNEDEKAELASLAHENPGSEKSLSPTEVDERGPIYASLEPANKGIAQVQNHTIVQQEADPAPIAETLPASDTESLDTTTVQDETGYILSASSAPEETQTLASPAPEEIRAEDKPKQESYLNTTILQILTIQRVGINGPLSVLIPPGILQQTLCQFVKDRLPRIELFQPQSSLVDSLTWAELHNESNEFMRGIFYYAGIDATTCEDLFVQTDKSDRQITNASLLLNSTLQDSWQQGAKLGFRLDSRNDRIELQIEDPSVRNRYVRASRRSSGFTHFFTLKTILHARRNEHPASSYVFLFDEPGIYLHPSGQYDLLRALEVIGQANQIIYSTHSIFMINRTFPARHRLVIKDSEGTKIDVKPYVGQWGAAFDALGLSLSGTALFASHVLFAEGDSETILIPAIFQALMAAGLGDSDLNAFAVLAMGDGARGDALIRAFLGSPVRPKLALLVDGDQGGKDRLKYLGPLLTAYDISSGTLYVGTTIEDYLPLVQELYPKALELYLLKVLKEKPSRTKMPDDEISEKVHESFAASIIAQTGVTKGIGIWGQTASKQFPELSLGVSKIGIAREYVALLAGVPPERLTGGAMKRSKDLLKQISELLALPKIIDTDSDILSSSVLGNSTSARLGSRA